MTLASQVQGGGTSEGTEAPGKPSLPMVWGECCLWASRSLALTAVTAYFSASPGERGDSPEGQDPTVLLPAVSLVAGGQLSSLLGIPPQGPSVLALWDRWSCCPGAWHPLEPPTKFMDVCPPPSLAGQPLQLQHLELAHFTSMRHLLN